MHLWRLEGVWQAIRRGEWGAMERQGFAGVETRTALETQVGLK